MGLSLSGLGSGFDWRSTVDQLRQVEVQQKISPLNAQKAKYSEKNSAWQSIGTKLSAFLTAIKEVKDTSDFDVFAPTFTSKPAADDSDSYISITTGIGAGKGRYDVQITELAQSEKIQSKTVAYKDAPGWSGNIVIEGKTISLTGSESLSTIRDMINAQNTGTGATGVTASILQVADNDFRLILSKDKAGSALNFTDAAGNYFLDDTATEGPRLQTFKTAKFKIDGIDFERSTNNVTDAIPGLTLNLLKETGATVITMDVDYDNKAIEDKIKKAVDTYNDVVGFINGQMTYNESTKTTGGALFGDTTLKSVKSAIQNAILNSGIAKYGLNFDRNSNLSLDSEDLSTSLDTKFNETISAFTSMAQSLDTILDNLTDSIDGTVTLQQQSTKKSIDRIGNKIQKTENWIEKKMAILTKQYINMDSVLSQMQTQQSWISNLM